MYNPSRERCNLLFLSINMPLSMCGFAISRIYLLSLSSRLSISIPLDVRKAVVIRSLYLVRSSISSNSKTMLFASIPAMYFFMSATFHCLVFPL